MILGKNHVLAAFGASALLVAAAAVAAEDQLKIEGVIQQVTVDRLELRTESGVQTIIISPSTEVDSVSGTFNSKERKPASVLISGLPVKVEGRQAGDAIAADEIQFKAKDYRTALQIQAGTQEVRASNEEVRAAVSKAGEYETKAETNIFFKTGSAVISEDGKRDLLQLATEAKKHQGYIISVLGYADPTGNPEANERLSNLRAQNVINFLKQRGDLQPGRVLAASALGEVEGIGGPLEEASYAESRRVTARIVVSKVQLSQ